MYSVLSPTDEDIDEQLTWIEKEIQEIGEETIQRLVDAAVAVLKNAYNPYSHFSVGSSILANSGNIYAAPNTEVASYSETGHAEGNAINKAISEGEAQNGRVFIRAVAVAGTGNPTSCGRCRQNITEHTSNALIIMVDESGQNRQYTSLKLLLPFAFGPANLGIT